MAVFICPHCQKEISLNVKKTPKKKEKQIDEPMNLKQFIEWCKKSPQKQVLLIAEWAETQNINFTMKSQWQVYIQRNSRASVELCKFSDDQIQQAFSKVEEDKKNGLKYTPALETLLKKLTK
jgi:hypothetical protein